MTSYSLDIKNTRLGGDETFWGNASMDWLVVADFHKTGIAEFAVGITRFELNLQNQGIFGLAQCFVRRV